MNGRLCMFALLLLGACQGEMSRNAAAKQKVTVDDSKIRLACSFKRDIDMENAFVPQLDRHSKGERLLTAYLLIDPAAKTVSEYTEGKWEAFCPKDAKCEFKADRSDIQATSLEVKDDGRRQEANTAILLISRISGSYTRTSEFESRRSYEKFTSFRIRDAGSCEQGNPPPYTKPTPRF